MPDQLEAVADGLRGDLPHVGDELEGECGRLLAARARAEVAGDVLALDVERAVHGGRGLRDLLDQLAGVGRADLAVEERRVALDLHQLQPGDGVDDHAEEPRRC